jgi:hypothetical protein
MSAAAQEPVVAAIAAIEVKWMHGKRAIVEPVRTLTPDELEERVFDYYLVPPTKHLQQHVL